MKIAAFLALLISCTSFAAQSSSSSSAKGASGPTLRLLGGASAIKPKDVNESFEAQHLQKVSASLLLGGELGYTLGGFGAGIRYINNQVSRAEEPSTPFSTYSGSISQDVVLAMAHIPLVKKDYFHLSLTGGYGGAATRVKVKSATQRGEINAKIFDTPAWMSGAAIAVGHKFFFFEIEGGYMGNKATRFTRSGTISTEIEAVDMSGTYAAINLVFYGGNFSDLLKIGK